MRAVVSIQALRAIAAIGVAIVHFNSLELMLTGQKDAAIPLYTLASGVDIFFVISGFIMVYSSGELFGTKDGYKVFLIKRVSRIAPIYWLSTALAIYLMDIPFDLPRLLKSLLFIPFMREDGNVAPLNGVGWSLNFEMFFYCLFACTLRMHRALAVFCVSMLLLTAVALGQTFHPKFTILWVWSDPIIIEFVFGMTIAILYERQVVVPSSLRLLLIAASMSTFWFFAPTMPPSNYRFLVWGLPAALLLGSAVLGRHEPDTGPLVKFTKLIGDSSYAIYLVHPLVGALMFRLWPLGLNQYPVTTVAALGVLTSVCVSVPIFWFVERNVTKAVQQFFLARLVTQSAPARLVT